MLRGPQTPGELRSKSGRLHDFADNDEVLATLQGLIGRDGVPLVVELPRTPGRKDPTYMHLFSGPIDLQAMAASAAARSKSSPSQKREPTELAERVSQLEAEVAALKRHLGIEIAD
jgi:uncharacterized protein YceH (UPF0502 family)